MTRLLTCVFAMAACGAMAQGARTRDVPDAGSSSAMSGVGASDAGSPAAGVEGASADGLLAAVDSALTGSARRMRAKPFLCGRTDERDEPGSENRDFLCEATSAVGAWTLSPLRASGGGQVSAYLELRRFNSPEAARLTKQTALERYGAKEPTSVFDGAISWCFLDPFWTDELLISLRYGCHISLRHVKALERVRGLLLSRASPFGESKAVAVVGSHSGWSWVIDAEGNGLEVPPEHRFRRFVRVHGVAPNDVLWVRGGPKADHERLDKLAPDARCVPVVMTHASTRWARVHGPQKQGWVRVHGPQKQGWVRVHGPQKQGWVHSRYVKDQPAEECVTR